MSVSLNCVELFSVTLNLRQSRVTSSCVSWLKPVFVEPVASATAFADHTALVGEALFHQEWRVLPGSSSRSLWVLITRSPMVVLLSWALATERAHSFRPRPGTRCGRCGIFG